MNVEYKTKYQALKDKLHEQVLQEERKYPLRQRERMLVDIIDELLTELDFFVKTGTTAVYTKEETI